MMKDVMHAISTWHPYMFQVHTFQGQPPQDSVINLSILTFTPVASEFTPPVFNGDCFDSSNIKWSVLVCSMPII